MTNKLAEEIYLLMKDEYFKNSSTFGEFWKKSVLLEFIQNSGLALGYRTLKEACGFVGDTPSVEAIENERLEKVLDTLVKEGYIKEVETPANFLFQGNDGRGFELILDAQAAENEAEERVNKEEAVGEGEATNTPAPQMAQPTQAPGSTGAGGDTGATGQ